MVHCYQYTYWYTADWHINIYYYDAEKTHNYEL